MEKQVDCIRAEYTLVLFIELLISWIELIRIVNIERELNPDINQQNVWRPSFSLLNWTSLKAMVFHDQISPIASHWFLFPPRWLSLSCWNLWRIHVALWPTYLWSVDDGCWWYCWRLKFGVHQLRLVVGSHYLQGCYYIPGGCLGFLPSTVLPEVRINNELNHWWLHVLQEKAEESKKLLNTNINSRKVGKRGTKMETKGWMLRFLVSVMLAWPIVYDWTCCQFAARFFHGPWLYLYI